MKCVLRIHSECSFRRTIIYIALFTSKTYIEHKIFQQSDCQRNVQRKAVSVGANGNIPVACNKRKIRTHNNIGIRTFRHFPRMQVNVRAYLKNNWSEGYRFEYVNVSCIEMDDTYKSIKDFL